MAYTPINWAENLDVDATKLDKMDNQIDANEQRLTDIEDGTNPVAEALVLASGLENFQMNMGQYEGSRDYTFSPGFTANKIVALVWTKYSSDNSWSFADIKLSTNSSSIFVNISDYSPVIKVFAFAYRRN